ncbi:DUF3159 domain-containing protein [Nonomuraea gerenzanensis]|uniref:PROBABLE CONSERVED INTEGRAL MEMBRANE ALANINE AND LEUCINE RICH PROTEIN n=1 Tax=Nonomuraea gerenzanensis TaxID=93944 RepID=A0A1M4DW16_9ACTN|nr:DUF3159 domain-containing protein [Nonomuraea gerenzanensis]UBU13099.1 DUF3159 domain-containing protein [Nonomuraea gerenzanensis]SBO90743.1 PROBABLE CONSERVED INTEGRAL MEMBRANE ALANINE AND LEUCINE RICH PROTEIN [Nonomuraea gerenzanensis]
MSDLALLRRAGLHLIETAAPVLGFTLVYATTQRLPLALTVALCLAAGVAVHRFVHARSLLPAIGGFGLAAGAAAIAALSGEATDFFLPVLVIRGTVVAVTPVMLLLRLPPVAVAAGVLTGRGHGWRRDPVRLRAYTIVNVGWMLGEGALVANQARLYLADRAVAMGAFKLLVEVPLHVLMVALMWACYRRLTRGERS